MKAHAMLHRQVPSTRLFLDENARHAAPRRSATNMPRSRRAPRSTTRSQDNTGASRRAAGHVISAQYGALEERRRTRPSSSACGVAKLRSDGAVRCAARRRFIALRTPGACSARAEIEAVWCARAAERRAAPARLWLVGRRSRRQLTHRHAPLDCSLGHVRISSRAPRWMHQVPSGPSGAERRRRRRGATWASLDVC
jgi:hypothetical protein